MAKLFKLLEKTQYNTPLKGLTGLGLETAIGAGASYAIGRAYGQHNDKWYGKKAAHIAAAAGKLGAVVTSALSGGHSTYIGGALNAVGQAGVDAYCLEMGLRHGRDKAGKKAALLPKTMALPAGAEEMTSIGALGAAPYGKGMSWDLVQEIANGH